MEIDNKEQTKKKTGKQVVIALLSALLIFGIAVGIAFIIANSSDSENQGYYIGDVMKYENVDVLVKSVSEEDITSGEHSGQKKVVVSVTLKNNKLEDFDFPYSDIYIKTQDIGQKYEVNCGLNYLLGDVIISGVSKTYSMSFYTPYSISEKNFIIVFDWGWFSEEKEYHLYSRNIKQPATDLFSIHIEELSNGKIVASKYSARSGESIMLTITPNVGYQLIDNAYYLDGVAYTNTSFIMPSKNIIITANFEKNDEAKKFENFCPVSVTSKFYKSSNNLYIKIENNVNVKISAVKFLIVPFDVYGNNILRYGYGDSEVVALYDDYIIPVGDYKSGGWTISGFSGINKLQVYVYSVFDENNVEWGSNSATTEMAKAFGISSWASIV